MEKDVGAGVEELELSYIVGGNITGRASWEKDLSVSYKTKNTCPMTQSSHS